MSVALQERRHSGRLPGRLFDPGGRHSLDDIVSLVWQRLDHPIDQSDCLVCGELLVWNGDQCAAECDACGAVLE